MRHVEASIKKRTKESNHGISFKYNERRGSIEVGSITAGSLFAQTSLKEGDEVVVVNKISFRKNAVDKLNFYMEEAQGEISVLATRNSEEPNHSTSKDCVCCMYTCQDCECNDCCTIC